VVTSALRVPIGLLLLASASCASTAVPATRASALPASAATTEPSQSPAAALPATAPPVPTVVALSDLVALDLGNRVGPYQARSAVWIPGQPVAVNHEFDFGIALGIESGAGIAAAKRQSKNEALAERLAKLDPLDPQALLQRLCPHSRSGCAKLVGARVRVYGLLFGERAARLRVLFELADGQPSHPIDASLSDAIPVERFAEPGVLAGAFEAELGRVLRLMEDPAAAPSAERGRCNAGDNATVEGHVIVRDEQRVVLAATDPEPVRVSCAASSFTVDPASGQPPHAPPP
jgi:hypothetical protein